jgi:hypothetical protein|nr:MAG TPA: hypothetical protein [Caudoviricetes sp.]
MSRSLLCHAGEIWPGELTAEESVFPVLKREYVFNVISITYNISCTKLMVQAGKSRRIEPRRSYWSVGLFHSTRT